MLRIELGVNLVNTIMRCVTLVSFAVLVNGVPTSTFCPLRGLPQGDHLSPYLFLFCAEAFSAMIRKKAENGFYMGQDFQKGAGGVSNVICE